MNIIRPTSFSDPDKDFQEPEDALELERIIKTRDEDITIRDLEWIFNGYLPAGTYNECLYFVDIAYERIDSVFKRMDQVPWEQLDGALDLLDRVCLWIRINWQSLSKDGLCEQMKTRYFSFLDCLIACHKYVDCIADLICEMNKWSIERFGDVYLQSRLDQLDQNWVQELLERIAKCSET